MPNRGFEVELVLALRSLLMGKILFKNDFQVINCATREEKFRAFDKVMSRMLYEMDGHSLVRVRNFKVSLGLIDTLKRGNSIIIDSGSDPKVFIPITKEKYISEYSPNFEVSLETAIRNLVNGEMLCIRDILAVSVADEIDLIDTFSLVLCETLGENYASKSEVALLNMFILKSLKLTSSFNINGVTIDSISREKYDEILNGRQVGVKK